MASASTARDPVSRPSTNFSTVMLMLTARATNSTRFTWRRLSFSPGAGKARPQLNIKLGGIGAGAVP